MPCFTVFCAISACKIISVYVHKSAGKGVSDARYFAIFSARDYGWSGGWFGFRISAPHHHHGSDRIDFHRHRGATLATYPALPSPWLQSLQSRNRAKVEVLPALLAVRDQTNLRGSWRMRSRFPRVTARKVQRSFCTGHAPHDVVENASIVGCVRLGQSFPIDRR